MAYYYKDLVRMGFYAASLFQNLPFHSFFSLFAWMGRLNRIFG